jgi:nitrite reductase/ring-hydroxylating ferredoxin subunit
MDARLSNGNINQNIVTCPFHAAKFDITTGKKVGEPVLEIPPDMEPLLSGKNIWKASAKRRHILKHMTRKTHMKLLSKEIL